MRRRPSVSLVLPMVISELDLDLKQMQIVKFNCCQCWLVARINLSIIINWTIIIVVRRCYCLLCCDDESTNDTVPSGTSTYDSTWYCTPLQNWCFGANSFLSLFEFSFSQKSQISINNKQKIKSTTTVKIQSINNQLTTVWIKNQ